MTKAEMEYVWARMGIVNRVAINKWSLTLWSDVQWLIKKGKRR